MAKKESAASSLRSQFKATSLKKLQKVVDEDDAMVGGGSNEYLNLVDGKTLKIRIFPAHPGEETFYIKRKCYWLSIEKSDGEMGRMTVLDSRVHGGTEMDLVDEYVKFAKKKWNKNTDKINALIGTGMESNSLNPQYSWLCYAGIVSEDSELRAKIWEFKKMVRDALNRLSFSEDDDEPIEVDPFTDPDEGLPVMVKYLKNPNKKKGEQYYDVKFAKNAKARPLTDDELEYFANLKPLSEIIPTYDMRMFDQALEGLQNFDEENDMQVFDDDEWLDIVEKVKAQYEGGSDDEEEKPRKKKTAKKAVEEPAEDEEEEEKPAPKKLSKKKPEPEEEEEEPEEEPAEDEEESNDDEGDEFDAMDRTELKKYIKKEGLDITVKKSWTDDMLRDEIRNAVKSDDEEEGEEEAEPETESEDEGDDAFDSDAEEEKPVAKVTLADIKKKLAKKK